MPNAKLRQMYAAMLRSRMLAARVVSAGGSAPQPKRSASTVGLDALQTPVVDFLRGRSVEQVLNGTRRSRPTGTPANCGAATRISAPPTGPERRWTAIGAAAALKARAQSTGAKDGAVLVCYMRPEDAQPAVWTRALAYVSTHKLPLLFVVLAAAKPQGSRTGQMASLAIRNRIPGMPVDQDDAVALYRVAQEAIGHARIGGGGALIECVRFIVEGTKLTRSDAITTLADYMLHRNVAGKRWMESEAISFAKRIGLQLAKAR